MTHGEANPQFGAIIKQWRKRLGISRKQLARRVGLGFDELVEFEQGLKELSLEYFNRIVIALEMAAAIGFGPFSSSALRRRF